MHKSAVVIIGVCILLNAPAFAAKPSFNYSKATHDIEQLICNDDVRACTKGEYEARLKVLKDR